MLWEEIAEPFFQENPQCKVPKGGCQEIYHTAAYACAPAPPYKESLERPHVMLLYDIYDICILYDDHTT